MQGGGPARWLGIVGLAILCGDNPTSAAMPSVNRRWSLGGFVEGYRVVEVDHATQRQRPSAVVNLNLNAELAPQVRFYLDTRSMLGGTPEHADGFGVFNLSDTFQNISPSFEVEEAYIDVLLADLDIRIGKQRFSWGRLDLFRPTDVLNPRRFNDPFIVDDEDAKIGIPAVKLAYFVPSSVLADTSATLVWVPMPVPFRFPLQDERWFPESANVPSSIVIPEDFFMLSSGSTITPRLHTDNAPPAQQLDEGAIALRLSGSWQRAEWSLGYYDGPETAPALRFSTSVYSPSAQEKIRNGQRPSIPAGDLQALVADATLRPLAGRIRLVGGDLAVPIGGFTTRFEAAYSFDRLIPRSTDSLLSLENIGATVGPVILDVVDEILHGGAAAVDLGDLFVKRDRCDWGAGIDYVIDGWVPLLQINQSILVNHRNQADLLVSDTDTRILLALRKLLMGDRFKIDLLAFQGIERSYTTGIARFSFALTDQVRLRFGYLLIAGTRQSIVGQYHDNDEAFFQLRYSF